MKIKASKKELEELYFVQKLSIPKLAEKFGCSNNTISYWMNFHGIKPRTTSEAVKLFARDKKIQIPKEDLIELYKKRRLPPSKIAEKYNCRICTVLNRLREYGIEIWSSNGTWLKITKEELKNLYEKQGLSTYEIAEKYNCCQATIWKRFKQFGIKARTPNALNSNVPQKQELIKLYIQRGLSTWEIEKQFGFSRSTVHRKLKEYRIKSRSLAASHFVHPRKDFSGDLIEEAYLIGFRLGDLRVRKMYKNSETISVECGTTREEQLELIKRLFQKYAPVWITKKNKRGARNIGVNLPFSFSFLLDDVPPPQVFENKIHFFSFLAGFTDAEGYIAIHDGRAIYALGNYDKELLHKINATLIKFGIDCRKPFISTKKGYVSRNGYVQNGDYWVLRMDKKVCLLKLFNSLKPHIKHSAKVKALKKAVENIRKRNKQFGNINMNTAS